MWAAASNALYLFLAFLHDKTSSWGLAIILLTVTVRLVLHPLNSKQLSSMQKMQKLQPRLKVIQEKYANDREALSRETMALYKENNVNPASGCLPLLVQLPILILLFNVLRRTSFGGATFLGISLEGSVLTTMAQALQIPFETLTDVGFMTVVRGIGAAPAGLLQLGLYLPNLILLVVIVVLTWYQQRMTSQGNPQMATMNVFMPLFMGFICLSMPGGVMLYWFMSSLMAVVQQWLVIRKVASEEKPTLYKEKPRSQSQKAEKAAEAPSYKSSKKSDYDDFIPRK